MRDSAAAAESARRRATADEADLVDAGMAHERVPASRPPGTTFTTPGGMPASWQSFPKRKARERRGLRRLDDDGAPGRESGATTICDVRERTVPREDRGDDADRLEQREVEELGAGGDHVAVQPLGPPGRVLDPLRRDLSARKRARDATLEHRDGDQLVALGVGSALRDGKAHGGAPPG